MEALLRRLTRRCEIHDRPSYPHIQNLEDQLGLPSSTKPTDPAGIHLNRSLIDCGHAWCRKPK